MSIFPTSSEELRRKALDAAENDRRREEKRREERADALDNAMSAGDGIASFNEPIGGGTPPADYPFCRRDPCPYWRGYCRRDPACNN
jgi:hypothetical protein